MGSVETFPNIKWMKFVLWSLILQCTFIKVFDKTNLIAKLNEIILMLDIHVHEI
jgi:hypothetical protein